MEDLLQERVSHSSQLTPEMTDAMFKYGCLAATVDNLRTGSDAAVPFSSIRSSWPRAGGSCGLVEAPVRRLESDKLLPPRAVSAGISESLCREVAAAPPGSGVLVGEVRFRRPALVVGLKARLIYSYKPRGSLPFSPRPNTSRTPRNSMRSASAS